MNNEQIIAAAEAVGWTHHPNAVPGKLKVDAGAWINIADLQRIVEALAAQGAGEPVAWEVYIPSEQHGYVVDDENDAQLMDDMTNHDDAVLTPLCACRPPAAEQVIEQTLNTQRCIIESLACEISSLKTRLLSAEQAEALEAEYSRGYDAGRLDELNESREALHQLDAERGNTFHKPAGSPGFDAVVIPRALYERVVVAAIAAAQGEKAGV